MGLGIIFYFSGTGNTEFVAKEFQANFQLAGTDITLQAIDIKKEVPDLSNYQLIGFGFPLYAWNLPINVKEFINRLPKLTQKQAFIFATMGGPTPLGSLGITADLLRKKGFWVIAAEGIEMPSNDNILFAADDPKSENSQRLRAKAREKVKAMVDAIKSGKGKICGNSVFLKLLSQLTGIWLNKIYRRWFHYHKFYADEKCVPTCYLCIQICPANNIRKENNQRVVFNRSCILCARCINCCPRQAIQYGKAKKKHRYFDPDYKPPILR